MSRQTDLDAALDRCRITNGSAFRLAEFDTEDLCGFDKDEKKRGKELLKDEVERLSELQEKLYAQDRHAALFVFQAMDAAGKDSTIEHAMSGINPQGCEVHSFKAPTSHELDHDFLWRCAVRTPERGRIGIWNRSHYEEVLVVRVHPELLAGQRLPDQPDENFWANRLEDIAAWERYLARQGYAIAKFFLHISKDEQKKRFLKRLDEPAKNWKFSLGDVEERKHFDEYMDAYEAAIRATAAPHAPWYVIPADRKWLARLLVARAMVQTLDGLGLAFPEVEPSKRDEIDRVRAALESEP
jgi:PPK2 family polyphosphate:nucleotide phosphotransferase